MGTRREKSILWSLSHEPCPVQWGWIQETHSRKGWWKGWGVKGGTAVLGKQQ